VPHMLLLHYRQNSYLHHVIPDLLHPNSSRRRRGEREREKNRILKKHWKDSSLHDALWGSEGLVISETRSNRNYVKEGNKIDLMSACYYSV
jgi:hypothetical protein